MKKSIYFILMGCALLFIASCGGNNSSVKSSLPANDYLGNLPAILDTYYKADSVIKADFEKREKNIKSEKDLEKYNEYREERK